MSMDEANRNNRIRLKEKEEYHDSSFQITPAQTLDKLNEVEDSKQSTDFRKINQYEEEIRDLRRYLATQMQNNDNLQEKLKSLTEKLEKSEAEVRKLENEAKLAAFEYEKLLEHFKKYENQIDLNNESIADLNAKLNNQLVENKLISFKIEMLYKEMRKNEKEVKNERDEAITKLLVSTERLAAEKSESSRCKQDLKGLNEQVELQKKKMKNCQVIFIVFLVCVTIVGFIGWALYLSNNSGKINY